MGQISTKALKELEKNPQPEPKRPPFPNKVKN